MCVFGWSIQRQSLSQLLMMSVHQPRVMPIIQVIVQMKMKPLKRPRQWLQDVAQEEIHHHVSTMFNCHCVTGSDVIVI